jgi:hypothetical protein
MRQVRAGVTAKQFEPVIFCFFQDKDHLGQMEPPSKVASPKKRDKYLKTFVKLSKQQDSR